MKLIFEQKSLLETSLSRLKSKNEKHQLCFITAYRNGLTTKQNDERNRSLQGVLDSLGYMDKTKVLGRYENQNRKNSGEDNYTDKEVSFAVCNSNDNQNFKSDMIKLMGRFDQESILFCEPEGKSQFIYNDGTATELMSWKFGKDAQFKSLINGRPLVIEELSNIGRLVRSQGQFNLYRKMISEEDE